MAALAHSKCRVVDLHLSRAEILTGLLERVKLHVRLAACAGLGRARAGLARRVALYALFIHQYADVW